MKFTTTAAAAGIAFMMAGTVHASTITFKNEPNATGIDRFSISCSDTCQGWLFDAEALDSSVGGLIDFQDSTYASGSGMDWETNLLASIANTTGSASKNDSPSNTFNSSASFLLFKIGQEPSIGVLANTSGGEQEFSFSEIGTGSGFSHVVEYTVDTDTPIIPLPAAGWLMLAGLGGLAVIRRRKKAA